MNKIYPIIYNNIKKEHKIIFDFLLTLKKTNQAFLNMNDKDFINQACEFIKKNNLPTDIITLNTNFDTKKKELNFNNVFILGKNTKVNVMLDTRTHSLIFDYIKESENIISKLEIGKSHLSFSYKKENPNSNAERYMDIIHLEIEGFLEVQFEIPYLKDNFPFEERMEFIIKMIEENVNIKEINEIYMLTFDQKIADNDIINSFVNMNFELKEANKIKLKDKITI